MPAGKECTRKSKSKCVYYCTPCTTIAATHKRFKLAEHLPSGWFCCLMSGFVQPTERICTGLPQCALSLPTQTSVRVLPGTGKNIIREKTRNVLTHTNLFFFLLLKVEVKGIRSISWSLSCGEKPTDCYRTLTLETPFRKPHNIKDCMIFAIFIKSHVFHYS